MKTLKKLYQLLLENFNNFNHSGICILIANLYYNNIITYKEYINLSENFQDRKIRIWSKFYWSKSYRGRQYGWWWELNEEGNKQRKLYLQHIINSL